TFSPVPGGSEGPGLLQPCGSGRRRGQGRGSRAAVPPSGRASCPHGRSYWSPAFCARSGNGPKSQPGGQLEKAGGCPPDDGPCLLSVPDQCKDDSQCPSTMKCCYQACFRHCVPRVSVKQGSCPEDRLQCLSPTKHLCHQDSDCSGKKRCCHSACGRDCRDPATG
ncbi:WAP four-disulfide core domain protein 5, partial [Microcebus murinus]|uniref:WAP four-disulfide core domain protein 5 n=1 Tax=Microcebus murinus TaxID=30608 RepID=UPI003F6A86C3